MTMTMRHLRDLDGAQMVRPMFETTHTVDARQPGPPAQHPRRGSADRVVLLPPRYQRPAPKVQCRSWNGIQNVCGSGRQPARTLPTPGRCSASCGIAAWWVQRRCSWCVGRCRRRSAAPSAAVIRRAIPLSQMALCRPSTNSSARSRDTGGPVGQRVALQVRDGLLDESRLRLGACQRPTSTRSGGPQDRSSNAPAGKHRYGQKSHPTVAQALACTDRAGIRVHGRFTTRGQSCRHPAGSTLPTFGSTARPGTSTGSLDGSPGHEMAIQATPGNLEREAQVAGASSACSTSSPSSAMLISSLTTNRPSSTGLKVRPKSLRLILVCPL